MGHALDITLSTSSGEQTTRFPLSMQRTTIGRLPSNAIQIIHRCISREHATIEFRHGHLYVHDHSSVGTWLNQTRLVRDGPGSVLRYDDELEFGVEPDCARRMDDPFRAVITYRLTMPVCTPLGQRSPPVQTAAMEPPPKRLRPDDSISALGAPLAVPDAPLADDAPAPALPFDASNLTISLPPDLHWVVFGNDPVDGSGIRSVLLAAHSRGKPECMLRAAFPFFTESRRKALVNMPATNVFRFKKGGKKQEAIDDAWTTCAYIIELAEKYESDLRLWGSGGAFDRIVQCSTNTGFVNPDFVRPITFLARPSEWERLGTRKTIYWEDMVAREEAGGDRNNGRCTSINLASVADGTATYRAELWRGGQLVTHFYVGNYPHPGSQSWGDVEARVHDHTKFLNDLADGIPSQSRIIKFNADDFE